MEIDLRLEKITTTTSFRNGGDQGCHASRDLAYILLSEETKRLSSMPTRPITKKVSDTTSSSHLAMI